jgi:outer membrane lipopolysaccharide assembly protein LptE/RlpB
MRNRFILLLFLAAASLSAACSWSSEANVQANTAASNSSSNRMNSATNVQTGSLAQANGQTAGGADAGDHPILRFEPAPEDSQVAVATKSNGQLYETRVFKRHPQLVKVDATSIGANEKELRILLRNGDVKNVTTDSLGELKQAATSQLLRLAGIRPGAPPMQGKTGAKELQ